MATPTNGNGNIVDEFEDAFHACLQVLTKEDEVSTTLEKDEIKMEIDQATYKFLDLARQMEAFFLQKRFLLSALKPELVVKEDILDLRVDLARKEELIKRHYDKIAVWQNLLADVQNWAKSPGHQSTSGSSVGTPGGVSITGNTPPNSTPPQSSTGGGILGIPPMTGPGISPMGGPVPSMVGSMGPVVGVGVGGGSMQMSNMQQQMAQQQQMQQQAQLQQQMQMQHMQQQGPPGMQNMVGGSTGNVTGGGGVVTGTNSMLTPQQAMFMQQQQQQQQNVGPRGPSFPVQQGGGPGGLLQGPLAYLEKTTSNIGMPDGRR